MESLKAAFQHQADVLAGKVPNQGPHAAALAQGQQPAGQGQQLAGQGQSQQQAAAAQPDPAEGAAATGTEDAAMG